MNILKPKDYPELLKEIIDPPPKLYIKGSLPKDGNKLLAVVGSRKFSEYGKRACEKLISDLSGYPVTVVSGLALGIDSIAHRAALKAGLQTIAIPGSGLDSKSLYPHSHKNLAKQIIESGGGLLSEFEPGTPGYPANFPKRNRIVAGMSHATLIVEANIKSGTLITARLAMDYNRDVLTIPNSIFSKTGEGPNDLIKHGATPILSAKDILQALGIKTDAPKDRSSIYNDCTENELNIISQLTEPMTRDELISVVEMKPSEFNTTLTILEIKGLAKESLGKIYLT